MKSTTLRYRVKYYAFCLAVYAALFGLGVAFNHGRMQWTLLWFYAGVLLFVVSFVEVAHWRRERKEHA